MNTPTLITSLNRTDIGNHTELVGGDASIYLTLAEFSNKRMIDLPFSAKDMISYLWNPYVADGPVFSVNDVSVLNDPSTLFVGAPFSHPFKDLKDIKWKLSTEIANGVIGDKFVTNKLMVYDNDIKFYNIFDSSSSFKLNDTKIDVFLDTAHIKDASNNDWDAWQYNIYQYEDKESGLYVLESSLGVKSYFNGPVLFTTDASAKMEYSLNDLYNVPLLTFSNFSCTDASDNIITIFNTSILDIANGNVGMIDSSINTTEYIKFKYSYPEQLINYDVVYESNRLPIYQIDPSTYYWQDIPDSTVLNVDNSTYTMKVNHEGDYSVEVYGWDSFNNAYYNQSTLKHRVWIKSPTIYTITNYKQTISIDVSTVSNTDVSTYITNNILPIYDRLYPMYGLTTGNVYDMFFVNIPSITYFQDLPKENSINRFYNLTERVLNVNGLNLTVDVNYQSFYTGDSVNIVKYNKGNYDFVASTDVSISGILNNVITVSSLSSEFVKDSSNDLYVINSTFRDVSTAVSYPEYSLSEVTISGYEFKPDQLIDLVVSDSCTGYSWGASYRVYDVTNYVHTLNNAIPAAFIDNPRYTIKAKHAFTTFSSTDIKTSNSSEINGNFKIYLDDNYNEQWYLDSTFAVINMQFDQSKSNIEWYDSSVNGSSYKKYSNPIIADTSTFVILTTGFDPSTYIKDQKNIWTVRYNESKDILFRAHNKDVPYQFSEKGYYDVEVESYDSFGNITSINCEGLINII